MYSREIDTFLKVAETGSFNRAARELYLSVPSVVQQINLLERRLGVQLLVRSKRGVSLTPQGNAFQNGARKIVRLAEQTREEMLQAGNEYVCGIGIRYTAALVQRYWPRLQGRYPGVSIRFISFSDEPGWQGELPDFCESLAMSPQMRKNWNSPFIAGCEYLPVRPVAYCLAVPPAHPWTEREHIGIADLQNATIQSIYTGRVNDADRLREELLRRCPGLRIEDCQSYSQAAVETSRMRNLPIIVPQAWEFLFPGFVLLPGEWETHTTCGFLYRRDCRPQLLEILREIARLAAAEQA